jgi:hypothetical protein
MCLEMGRIVKSNVPNSVYVWHARSEKNKTVKAYIQKGWYVMCFSYDREDRIYFAIMEETKETFQKRIQEEEEQYINENIDTFLLDSSLIDREIEAYEKSVSNTEINTNECVLSDNEVISINGETKNMEKVEKKMNRQQQLFVLVNEVTKALEGNRQACIKLAWKLVKEDRLHEVNKIVAIDTIIAIETIQAEKAPSKKTDKIQSIEKAKTEKAPKAPKAKKEKIEIVEMVKFPEIVIPSNILVNFGETVNNTIFQIINQAVNGVKIGNGENAKFFKGWNVLTGEFLQEKIRDFQDGMKALETVTDWKMLQCVMISYFLKDIAKRMISKYCQMGVYYKKLDKREENVKMYLFQYENAPSTDEVYSKDMENDIFQQLVMDSLEKTFSVKMFDEVAYATTSIYYRISNVIRKMKGKRMDKVVRELKANSFESYSELKTDIFHNMDFLSETEKEIMEMIVNGYSFKEIDQIKQQRMDRKVKSLRNKLESMSHMTIKEAKAEQKAIIEKQKEAKKEMISRKREEQKTIKTVELGKAVKHYAVDVKSDIQFMEKQLGKANIEMIEKMEMLAKFGSKAI